MNIQRVVLFSISLLLASSVQAHTGVGAAHSFSDGLLHPLLGIDHLLVMLAVGWWAAMMGGRALWLLPSSFLAMMAVGAGISFTGLALPFAELWVAASVLASGLVIMANRHVVLGLAAALVGVFAISHGYVHAAELENSGQILSYVPGFLLATALLHGLGLMLGWFGLAKLKIINTSFGLLCSVVGAVLLVNA